MAEVQFVSGVTGMTKATNTILLWSFISLLYCSPVGAQDKTFTAGGKEYPCTGVGFNSAIAALPQATNGIVDARGCTSPMLGQTTTVSVGDNSRYGVTGRFFATPSASFLTSQGVMAVPPWLVVSTGGALSRVQAPVNRRGQD